MTPNREEVVYHKIKRAIVRRYIRPGSQLVESTLARQLDVSRTPVRGAIKRLAYDGFARLESHRGAFVVQPSEVEVRQTFAVRTRLETMAAREAAGRIDDTRLAELHRVLEDEAAVFADRDIERYCRINDRFHFIISGASGNAVLDHYIRELAHKTEIFLVLLDPFFQMEVNPSIEEHRQIVAALERHDATAAEQAMAAHLNSSLEGLDLTHRVPDDFLQV